MASLKPINFKLANRKLLRLQRKVAVARFRSLCGLTDYNV